MLRREIFPGLETCNEHNEFAKAFEQMRKKNGLDTIFEEFKELSRGSRKSLPDQELRKILETALDIEDIRRGNVSGARNRDLNAIFDMGRHLFERRINSTPARSGIGAPRRIRRRRSRSGIGAPRREAVRIKREVMAEIINSARRGGTFARLPRV